VTPTGLEGDRQRDRRYHGGPERALCLFSAESMERLRAEGHPIAPGTTGENVLIAGLEWSTIVPSVRLRLGDEVVVQVASYCTPCWNIRASFLEEDFNRMHHKKHRDMSRLYARVLATGKIAVGDAVTMLEEDS
jgi:MOSC domain-containing protein YiiM